MSVGLSVWQICLIKRSQVQETSLMEDFPPMTSEGENPSRNQFVKLAFSSPIVSSSPVIQFFSSPGSEFDLQKPNWNAEDHFEVKIIFGPQHQNFGDFKVCQLIFLYKVQLSRREFDSWLWHRSKGKNHSRATCGSGRQNTCMQK